MALSPKPPAPDQTPGKSEGGVRLRWLLAYADMITLLLAFFLALGASAIPR